MFSCEVDKPMMEMRAGSNRWYQAHVVAESQNEVQVIFPGVPQWFAHAGYLPLQGCSDKTAAAPQHQASDLRLQHLG